MSENPIGVPWDSPDADPIGDIARYVEQVRSRPFLIKIKVTRDLYDRVRRASNLHPVAIDSVIIQLTGVPLEIDDRLPAHPGWEAVWSS
jgi:hypothetical protein